MLLQTYHLKVIAPPCEQCPVLFTDIYREEREKLPQLLEGADS
jgi:hypothetical protein